MQGHPPALISRRLADARTTTPDRRITHPRGSAFIQQTGFTSESTEVRPDSPDTLHFSGDGHRLIESWSRPTESEITKIRAIVKLLLKSQSTKV